MCDVNTGIFSKMSACIRMPPWEKFAKMYQTVRLQSNQLSAQNQIIDLGYVHAVIEPQFGWYNIISATVYGPYTHESRPHTTVWESTTSVSDYVDLAELTVQPHVNFELNQPSGTYQSTLSGPANVVNSGAGRRGMCKWHWSDKDQSVAFADTDSVYLIQW